MTNDEHPERHLAHRLVLRKTGFDDEDTRLTGDPAMPAKKTSQGQSICEQRRAMIPAMARRSSPSRRRTPTIRFNGATPRRR